MDYVVTVAENIKTDTFQYGLAMIFSHLFAGHSLFADNCANSKTILLTLIGFAIYQFASTAAGIDKIGPSFIRVTLDDTLKFATAMFFAKLLSEPSQVISSEFGLGTLHLMLSFGIYNLILSKYLISKIVKSVEPEMRLSHIMALNDTFKFIFVLLLTGILNNLNGIGKLNLEYLRLTIGYAFGIVGFDLFFA